MEGKIRAQMTKEDICVEMPEEIFDKIQDFLMQQYGIGIDEALRQYTRWIAEKPDEFKKWIEEIRADEKTGEHTENLED